MRKLSLIGLLLVGFTLNAFALTIEGQTFPDKVKIDQKELMINGAGMRLATWFKVKVYAGALYLEKKTSSLNDILKFQGPKLIHMKFMREVDQDKIQNAWVEGIKKNTDKFSSVEKDLKTLNAQMQKMNVGDEMKIIFYPTQVMTEVKGKMNPAINNTELAVSLLKVFLDKAPNDELRDGMLGK